MKPVVTRDDRRGHCPSDRWPSPTTSSVSGWRWGVVTGLGGAVAVLIAGQHPSFTLAASLAAGAVGAAELGIRTALTR